MALHKNDVMTMDGPCMATDKMCTCSRPIDHTGAHSCVGCTYTWRDENTKEEPPQIHSDIPMTFGRNEYSLSDFMKKRT